MIYTSQGGFAKNILKNSSSANIDCMIETGNIDILRCLKPEKK